MQTNGSVYSEERIARVAAHADTEFILSNALQKLFVFTYGRSDNTKYKMSSVAKTYYDTWTLKFDELIPQMDLVETINEYIPIGDINTKKPIVNFHQTTSEVVAQVTSLRSKIPNIRNRTALKPASEELKKDLRLLLTTYFAKSEHNPRFMELIEDTEVQSIYTYPIFCQKIDGNFYNAVNTEAIETWKRSFDPNSLSTSIMNYFNLIGFERRMGADNRSQKAYQL